MNKKINRVRSLNDYTANKPFKDYIKNNDYKEPKKIDKIPVYKNSIEK